MKTAEDIVNNILKIFGLKNNGSFLEKLELINSVAIEATSRNYSNILKNIQIFERNVDYNYIDKLIKEDKKNDLGKRIFKSLIYQLELLDSTNNLTDNIRKNKIELEHAIECYMEVKKQLYPLDAKSLDPPEPVIYRILLEENEDSFLFVEYYDSIIIGLVYKFITIKK